MPLTKKMSDVEINKICKLKPAYEETYKKGVVVNDMSQIAKILKEEGTFAEMVKHASLNDEIEAITVKIYFNKK